MFRLVSQWVLRPSPTPLGDDFMQQIICRTREVNGVTNDWEKRIVELSDGRTTAEIIEIRFKEEVRMGAWAADIGLWKGLFDRDVMATIRELARQGYIKLQPEAYSEEVNQSVELFREVQHG